MLTQFRCIDCGKNAEIMFRGTTLCWEDFQSRKIRDLKEAEEEVNQIIKISEAVHKSTERVLDSLEAKK